MAVVCYFKMLTPIRNILNMEDTRRNRYVNNICKPAKSKGFVRHSAAFCVVLVGFVIRM